MSKSEVKDIFKFLHDNIYVKLKGKIHQKIIRVPIGCDCAPFLANLNLFFYKSYKYVSDFRVNVSRLKSFLN